MNLFNQMQARRPKANKFNLSHEKKLSLRMGALIPIYTQSILPGDNFRCNTEIFTRLAPMLAPIMHRINVWTHSFFVPNRLVWNEWEDFITGGKDGTLAPVHPFITYGDSTKAKFVIKSLADYLGVPTNDGTTTMLTSEKISALPFRAYQLIWNEYFRDQNCMNEVDFSRASGEVISGDLDLITDLKNRAWEKDYFTSCLPWAQRSPITVTVPFDFELKNPAIALDSTGDFYTAGTVNVGGSGALVGNPSEGGMTIDAIENGSMNIEDLRRSVRLQEWLEKNARGGARYIEQILQHFGVISDDARLQRPEYLGGAKSPISISEVLQTSGTAGTGGYTDTPLGEMAGHGISASSRHGFNRRFKEHGYVMTLMSIVPVTSYMQGIPKHFQRFDKLDYPWPEFAQLGEQPVKNKELVFDHSATDGWNESTFGYQSRYAEEKYNIGSVHGDMRETLDYWHMARIFSGRPALNSTFVGCTPTKRIFAVESQSEDEVYCQVYHNISALRSLPYFNTPTL